MLKINCCHLLETNNSLFGQRHQHAPVVHGVYSPPQESSTRHSGNKFSRSMMFDKQKPSEFTDMHWILSRPTSNSEKRLILLRGQARFAHVCFTEREENPELVTKLSKRPIVDRLAHCSSPLLLLPRATQLVMPCSSIGWRERNNRSAVLFAKKITVRSR